MILNYEKTAYFSNSEVILKKGMLIKMKTSVDMDIANKYKLIFILDIERNANGKIYVKFVATRFDLDRLIHDIKYFTKLGYSFSTRNLPDSYRVGGPEITMFNKGTSGNELIYAEMHEELLP